MAFSYDHTTDIIHTDSIVVDIQSLINSIREHEASEEGIRYDTIASASGKESLGGSVAVGITVELLNQWQLQFSDGNYIAKVSGGNLVGGLNGDPIAYSPGVQVLLIQSAASTVVDATTPLTPEESAALLDAEAAATLTRKHMTNKAVVSEDSLTATIYDDDQSTELLVFDLSSDRKTRVPR